MDFISAGVGRVRGRVCACACACACACVRVWFTTHMHVGLANVDRALYSIHYRFSFDVDISSER